MCMAKCGMRAAIIHHEPLNEPQNTWKFIWLKFSFEKLRVSSEIYSSVFYSTLV